MRENLEVTTAARAFLSFPNHAPAVLPTMIGMHPKSEPKGDRTSILVLDEPGRFTLKLIEQEYKNVSIRRFGFQKFRSCPHVLVAVERRGFPAV